jgi:ElaB/YqjD/DUF883 family membrane-anchored ribosome-binding protein
MAWNPCFHLYTFRAKLASILLLYWMRRELFSGKGERIMADTHDIRTNVENAASQAGEKVQQAASAAMSKAQDLASTASQRVDEATAALGERVRSAGSTIRERGPREGMLGSATEAVAGSLEHTGRYIQEEGLVGMAEDIAELIRRNPIPSMMVGIGLGFMLAKMLRR